jgi:hypothetical protein
MGLGVEVDDVVDEEVWVVTPHAVVSPLMSGIDGVAVQVVCGAVEVVEVEADVGGRVEGCHVPCPLDEDGCDS